MFKRNQQMVSITNYIFYIVPGKQLSLDFNNGYFIEMLIFLSYLRAMLCTKDGFSCYSASTPIGSEDELISRFMNTTASCAS